MDNASAAIRRTKRPNILLKNESSLNRLKIAFSAYYSQQKVNKRETDEKPSVYEHYEHIKT